MSAWLCSSTVSRPSVIATSTEVAPKSIPANRSPPHSRTSDDGRPPRDSACPASSTSPLPASRSSSTATFDFDSITASVSSARDNAPRSRSSRSINAWFRFCTRRSATAPHLPTTNADRAVVIGVSRTIGPF
jgi:hypothetical protein